ncbi:hypothetical protein [Cytobacillus luteolus]|nr:hypothetical protein [Cytobacillus luteolus]MBP1943722.1 hypothetical protein [Cytobacillus luteolus]
MYPYQEQLYYGYGHDSYNYANQFQPSELMYDDRFFSPFPPGGPMGPPSGPPSGIPSGGLPFTSPGQSQAGGPPPGPPPAGVPIQQQASAFAVDPGSIRGCLFRYTYLWLTNGQQFWFYPTFVGRRSVSGWRWTGFMWVYFGTDLRRVRSFTCV